MKAISKSGARAYLGGLGQTDAMPCSSYGISRKSCCRGKSLRKIPGTVCASCYSATGNYTRPQVFKKNELRLERMLYSVRFVDMFVIALEGESFFRFFDTGDIPNLWCLERIMDIIRQCSWCRFWIPTREYETVNAYLAVHGDFPANLNVRISADYLDQLPRPEQVPKGCTFSTVATLKHPDGLPGSKKCLPSFEGHLCERCRDAGCRSCWDRNVPHVCYKQH